MIASACFKSVDVIHSGKRITLQRGQLSFSVRFLAQKWGWDIGKVQRFLSLLKTDTMIDTKNDTGQLIVTICNYEIYQSPEKKSDTLIDTPNDTEVIQERYASDTKKKSGNTVKKEKKGKKQEGMIFDEEKPENIYEWFPAIADTFDKFREHRKKMRKGLTGDAEELALKALDKLIREGNDARLVIEQSIFRGWAGLFPLKADAKEPAKGLSFAEQKELRQQEENQKARELYEQSVAQ